MNENPNVRLELDLTHDEYMMLLANIDRTKQEVIRDYHSQASSNQQGSATSAATKFARQILTIDGLSTKLLNGVTHRGGKPERQPEARCGDGERLEGLLGG